MYPTSHFQKLRQSQVLFFCTGIVFLYCFSRSCETFTDSCKESKIRHRPTAATKNTYMHALRLVAGLDSGQVRQYVRMQVLRLPTQLRRLSWDLKCRPQGIQPQQRIHQDFELIVLEYY